MTAFYPQDVLPTLRDRQGKPAAHVRFLALLVAIGMLMLAAPALVPLARWLVGLL